MNENTNISEDPGKGKGAEPYEIRQIPIDKIKIADFCRRRNYDRKKLDLLKKSIKRIGLIHCPSVRQNSDGTFLLIVGSRRFEACKSLGWERLPCHVKRDDRKEDDDVTSLAENIARLGLHPVQQAKAMKQRIKRRSMTEAQIAAEVGLPQSCVSERIGILKLPKDIQQMIGVEPESPLKLTHAGRLSNLMRTDRFYREIEVRKLAKKTTTSNLSSGQLGDHVTFIKSGNFDLLTDRLKDPFWEDKWMRPFLGNLFLYPQDKDFIPDNLSNAEALRKKAGRLTPDQLERFVLSAVERRWTNHEVQKNFAGYIETVLPETQNVNPKKPPDFLEILATQISYLVDRLVEADYKIPAIAESQSHKLLGLRDLATRLMEELERFTKKVEEITQE